MARRRDSIYRYRYRGRKSKKPLLIALGVLCAALAVFCFFLSDYIIVSADGFRFGSQPGRQEQQRSEAPEDERLPELVIQGQDPEPDPLPEVPETPTAPEEPVRAALTRLYPADVNRAAEPDYLAGCIAAAKAGGYEAVVLTVRSEEGTLYLPCGSSYAAANVDGQANAIAAAVREAAADFPFAALLPVCRDGSAPRLHRDQALKTEGVTWLDHAYTSWFDPCKEGAGDYAEALLESCKEAGFSQVVLSRLSFPGRGKLDLIETWAAMTEADRQEAVTALAGRLHSKAEALELGLSLLLEPEHGKRSANTGQQIGALAPLFDMLYLQEQDEGVTGAWPGTAFGLYTARDGYVPAEGSVGGASNVP